jgi:aminoglycoside phosphotransferase (APT) family kinase protein
VAADPTGAHAGVAASLQTCLPGDVDVVHLDVDLLAEAVLAVHDAGADASGLPPVDPWADVEVPPTDGAVGLVHRDLHPGNVLVAGGRLTGIVDWVHARRGPVEADVSRCRVELAVLAGLDAADAFLERCRPLVPHYDRAWDALVVAELRPWAHTLLAFNDLGARLSPEGIEASFDALGAQPGWAD